MHVRMLTLSNVLTLSGRILWPFRILLTRYRKQIETSGADWNKRRGGDGIGKRRGGDGIGKRRGGDGVGISGVWLGFGSLLISEVYEILY